MKLWLPALLLVLGGCTTPTVVRSAGGQIYRGRFIQARAYEAYAQGALAEADGRFGDAARSYRIAAESDERGPDAWARLGAVLCKKGDLDEAREAFDRAVRTDATSASAYRERGRCALSRGDEQAALDDLGLAVILDPDDEATVLLMVDALEKEHRAESASRLLVSQILAGRATVAVVTRLSRMASERKDPALARIADEARERSVAGAVDALPLPAKVTRADVDAALLHGDLPRARRMALRAKVGQGELALRALALGLDRLATEQATLVLDADPRDPSAAIAVVLTTPAGGVAASLDRAVGARLERSSLLGRFLLAERVAREVAIADARALVTDAELATPREDLVEERLRARIQKILAR